MLSFTHTIVSLPFAYWFDSPLFVFAAAFVFHLVADTLLHWNLFPEQSKKFFYPLVALEIIGGVVAAMAVVGQDILTINVLAAIAGGNAPDVIHQLYFLLSPAQRKKYFTWAQPAFDFHNNIQSETPFFFKGMISQVILIGLTLLLFRA